MIIAAEKRPMARKARMSGGDPAGENAVDWASGSLLVPSDGEAVGGGVGVVVVVKVWKAIARAARRDDDTMMGEVYPPAHWVLHRIK